MSNLANDKVILKISKSVLVQKRSFFLYSSFFLNLYIVYELRNWPQNPTNSFPLKSYLFGTVKLVRNTIQSEFTYNG